MRIGDLGGPELILIVLALVLVFGAGKLGDIGGALGKSVREFKRASHDDAPAAEEVGSAQRVTAVSEQTMTGGAVERTAPADAARVADYRPSAGRA